MPPDTDISSWYTRCPDCGLVGPPSSAEYTLAGPPPTGEPDWSAPARLGCSSCGQVHLVAAVDLLPLDGEHTCPRCQATTPVPAAAAEVVCRSCHLWAPGLAARTDPAVADKRDVTQGLHALELRETWLEAKRRHGLA